MRFAFDFSAFDVGDVINQHILDCAFFSPHGDFGFPNHGDLLSFPDAAFFGELTKAVGVHSHFVFAVIGD